MFTYLVGIAWEHNATMHEKNIISGYLISVIQIEKEFCSISATKIRLAVWIEMEKLCIVQACEIEAILYCDRKVAESYL